MSTLFQSRWWIYQKERFPVVAHGALILAFSLCAVCFSALLRESLPSWKSALIAFVTSFISFLHLRLADEFKDFEDDSKFRPYRPVPRGLVSLRDLAVVWVLTGAVQFTLAVGFDWRLIFPLAVTWIYLALMSREFFCHAWLKRHPFTYMWTHMVIMPLIDFYATACDWMPAQGKPPEGLFWFVAASFFNGFVIEIGRKIRAPEDEETGVETYSFLWGRQAAVGAWWIAIGLTTACALKAAARIHFLPAVAALLALVCVAVLGIGILFLKNPKPGAGKRIELVSGLWTLLLYLSLGVIPAAWQIVLGGS